MILPFPSSPHCAPTRIVFAISIQTRAKNFPTHLARQRTSPSGGGQDAVGTCPRMIRTARLRASGFEGQTILPKKNDQAMGRLRSKVNAHYSTPRSDSVVARIFADLAIQRRLGLLSER